MEQEPQHLQIIFSRFSGSDPFTFEEWVLTVEPISRMFEPRDQPSDVQVVVTLGYKRVQEAYVTMTSVAITWPDATSKHMSWVTICPTLEERAAEFERAGDRIVRVYHAARGQDRSSAYQERES